MQPLPSLLNAKLPLFVSAAADDAGLSVHAFRVLARVCRRWSEESGCYESAANMAAGCRMKRKTIFSALSELEERGMIRRTERPGMTTRIDLVAPDQWTEPGAPKGTGTRSPKQPVPNGGAGTERVRVPGAPKGTGGVPNGAPQREPMKGTHEGKDAAAAREAVRLGAVDEMPPNVARYAAAIQDTLAQPEAEQRRRALVALRAGSLPPADFDRALAERREGFGALAFAAAVTVTEHEADARGHSSRLRFLDSVLESIADHARRSRLAPDDLPANGPPPPTRPPRRRDPNQQSAADLIRSGEQTLAILRARAGGGSADG